MITMLTGDCRDVLRTLPDASVHCVVTSPPYWGLRDYGTAIWQGGDVGCSHKQYRDGAFSADGGMPGGRSRDGAAGLTRNACHCGAIRIDAQLGLEPDFNAYVANMVAVFREVRRVLRDDGTLWLNLGDSYAANGIKSNNNGTGKSGLNCLKPGYIPPYHQQDVGAKIKQEIPIGLKPKDLCGIPWRVAFALQADGWYLRQDIIWSKPNPMPESVTDRCTKAHEYLFLLSKRERYYYDADAIREPHSDSNASRLAAIKANGGTDGPEIQRHRTKAGVQDPNGSWARSGIPGVGSTTFSGWNEAGRNKRSVWEVTTQPFSEAHFATFPPALIEPCIKAGCPIGGTVLDPFAGAGTTGLVADRLQRNAILIELNPIYAAMGERRIVGDAPLFVEVAP